MAGDGDAPAPPTPGGAKPDGAATFLLHGVRGEAAFWRISAILSETAIGGSGVDIVYVKDEVKLPGAAEEDEEGCLLVVSVRSSSDVLKETPWSRAEDNEMRELQAGAAKGSLTEAEQARLAALEPRFEEFMAQGLKAMGDMSVTAFVGWLPYTLLMSINPGLLSKKARRTVEALATLPLVTGTASSPTEQPIPAAWRGAFLIPTTHLLGIRCFGNILFTTGLKLYFARQSPPPAVLHEEVDLSHFEVDPSLCVTKITVEPRSACPLALGDLLVKLDDKDAGAHYKSIYAAVKTSSSPTAAGSPKCATAAAASVCAAEVIPTCQTDQLHLAGGGASGLFKALQQYGITFRKGPKNDNISWVANGKAQAPP
eukprot:TRINITY_DN11438_c0_g1_i1.p1 TRINITY_DN11438_c0_g1~~TRINITY_DN11438_c0_g1_i1.p1  ORF type:complete len:382 (+),score=136.00 TRINITY_DN11438_c0_g1_i1:37-1146(+)